MCVYIYVYILYIYNMFYKTYVVFSKSFVSECPRGYKWLPTTSPGKGFLNVGYAIFSFST